MYIYSEHCVHYAMSNHTYHVNIDTRGKPHLKIDMDKLIMKKLVYLFVIRSGKVSHFRQHNCHNFCKEHTHIPPPRQC